MPSVRQTSVPMWVQQTDEIVDESPPTSGLKYTLLDTVKNVRIISIYIKVTWTGQPDPLEVHVTIDGVAMRFFYTNPVSEDEYQCTIRGHLSYTAQTMDTTEYGAYKVFLIEGKSVKVEVETTGGTVSNLYARVKYALRR